MMYKRKLNIQIVSMRKYVKQAKLLTINKLSKDVKQFQTKKGTESQLEKYKRKTERLLREIEIIKKIPPDTVSKVALTSAKNWKNILSDKSATLEDRSLAMLADFELVQNEVTNFLSKNSHLVSKIPKLIQEWETRKKETPDKSTSKHIKASEIRQRKKEFLTMLKTGSKNRNKISKSFTENPTRKSEINEEEPTINEGDNTNLKIKDDINYQNLETVTDEGTKNLKPEKNYKAIKSLNLDEIKDLDEILVEHEQSDSEDPTVPSVEKTKNDPFFLGDKFMSGNDDDDECEKLSVDEPISLHKQFTDSPQRPMRGGHNFHSNRFNSQATRGRRFPERNQFCGNFRNSSSRSESDFKDGRKDEHHGRGRFQNFRSKFPRKFPPNRSDSVNFLPLHNKFGNFKSSGQNKSEKGELNQKPLHPSWEAKRKLKESLHTASQGKRTVFN